MALYAEDLLKVRADAILISANNDLILGGGISGAVARLGGPSIQQECNRIGTIPLGRVAVTAAGELPFRHIFHAAVRPLGLWADEGSLRSAVREALREAQARGVRVLAMAALGTGGGGLSADRASAALADELAAAALAGAGPQEVHVVISDLKLLPIYRETFRRRLPADGVLDSSAS